MDIRFIKLQCVVDNYELSAHYVICDIETGQVYNEQTFEEEFGKLFCEIATANINMFTIQTERQTRQIDVKTYKIDSSKV